MKPLRHKSLIAMVLVLALSSPLSACANANASAISDPNAKPDIDLTALSSTMVLAEVTQIMLDPSAYAGKTIKLHGPYAMTTYEEAEGNLHFIVITDATACCQSGIRFIWQGEHQFPDDYPLADQEIEITGVMDVYEQFGQDFAIIYTDKIKVL